MKPIEDWEDGEEKQKFFQTVGMFISPGLGNYAKGRKQLNNKSINKDTVYHSLFSPQYFSVINKILLLNKVSQKVAKEKTRTFIAELIDGTAPELITEELVGENLARKDIFDKIGKEDGWKLSLENMKSTSEQYKIKRGSKEYTLSIDNIDKNYSAEKVEIALNFSGAPAELIEVNNVIGKLINSNVELRKQKNKEIQHIVEGKGFDL